MRMRCSTITIPVVVMTTICASTARGQDNATTAIDRVAAAHPALDRDDPRELAMKVRALLQDEYMFFRGSAAEFYRVCDEIAPDWMQDPSIRVTLHGDVHIGNVGTYRSDGSAGRDVRFGLVDLDESFEGPFQLDLLRGFAAIRFACKEADRPLDDAAAGKVAKALCNGYAQTLSGSLGYDELIKRHKAVSSLLKKAAKNEALKYVERYADVDGQRCFRATRVKNGAVTDMLERLEGPERDRVLKAVGSYFSAGSELKARQSFRFQTADELVAVADDVARWTRLGSSGSQGVHKYLVLISDNPLREEAGPLILELKEEPPPAAAVAGILDLHDRTDRGSQVAAAYHQMLDPPPRLLGSTRIGEQSFLVRTKDPWNEDLEPDDFDFGRSDDSAVEAATVLGEVTGLAHRQGLIRSNQIDRIEPIRAKVDGLSAVLQGRSLAIEERLRREYEALCADPKAQELARKANDYIGRVA